MEIMTCHSVRATRGLSSSGARATDLPIGAPNATLGWRMDREKSYVDPDCARLYWAVGTSKQCVVGVASRQGMEVATFNITVFSSCREVLSAMKEAN